MHRSLERVRGHKLTCCKLGAHSKLKPAEGRGNCLQDATPGWHFEKVMARRRGRGDRKHCPQTTENCGHSVESRDRALSFECTPGWTVTSDLLSLASRPPQPLLSWLP